MSSEFAICQQITPQKLFHCFLKKNCFILLEYCKRSDTPRCFEPLTISQYAPSLVLRALFPGNLQGQQQSREVSSFIAGSKSLNRLKILNLTLLTSPTNSESKPSTFYFTFQKTKHICTVRYKKTSKVARANSAGS